MNKMICVALVFVFLLCGCGNMTKSKGAAEAGVVTFHNQFNAGKVNGIISTAEPDMFDTTPKTKACSFLNTVRNKLGKTVNSKMTGWNVRMFNTDTTVVLVENTKFENGTGTETFTFRIKNQKAYLLGYYINSRNLAIK